MAAGSWDQTHLSSFSPPSKCCLHHWHHLLWSSFLPCSPVSSPWPSLTYISVTGFDILSTIWKCPEARALINAPLIPAGFRSFLWNPVESRGIKFGRDNSQNHILQLFVNHLWGIVAWCAMWKSYIKLSSCVNTGVQTSSPKCLTDFPWDLLIVIQNARWTGNCLQCNWNGSSPFKGSNFIQGMNGVSRIFSSQNAYL